MTKTSLCLTSLVAAVPGGWLAYLMVMGFLSNPGKKPGDGDVHVPTSVLVLSGILLAIGALLAVMPVGILLFAGPKTPKPTPDADKSGEPEPEATTEKAEPVAEDESELEVADAVDAETVQYESDDQAIPDEFDLGSDFDMDLQEAEDEDAGKKKKK